MNEKNINNIIKEYKSFKESLNKDIKNKLSSKLINNRECYLIKKIGMMNYLILFMNMKKIKIQMKEIKN